MRIFGSSRYGASESYRCLVIHSVLLPRVAYGAHVWMSAARKTSITKLTARTDRMAGIFILGVYKTTSLDFIRSRLSPMSLLMHFLQSSFSFFHRKISILKPNGLIRDVVLDMLQPPTFRSPPSHMEPTLALWLSQLLSMGSEHIHLHFDFQNACPSNLTDMILTSSKDSAKSKLLPMIR